MAAYLTLSLFFCTIFCYGSIPSLSAGLSVGASDTNQDQANPPESRIFHPDTCYVIQLVNVTWNDSKTWCEDHNMTLPVIETEDEFNMITKAMDEAGFNALTWVGLVRNSEDIIEWVNGQRLAYNKYSDVPSYHELWKGCGRFDGAGFVMENCTQLGYTFCETHTSVCQQYSRKRDCHGRQRECECPVWMNAQDFFGGNKKVVRVNEDHVLVYHTTTSLLGLAYKKDDGYEAIFNNGTGNFTTNNLSELLVLAHDRMTEVSWEESHVMLSTPHPFVIYAERDISQTWRNIVKSKGWPAENPVSMALNIAYPHLANILQCDCQQSTKILIIDGMCGGTEHPAEKEHVCYYVPKGMEPTDYQTAVDNCRAENSILANFTDIQFKRRDVYDELLMKGLLTDYWAGFSDRQTPGSPVHEDGFLGKTTRWLGDVTMYGGCTMMTGDFRWEHVPCSTNVSYMCAAGRCWGEPAWAEGRTYKIEHELLADHIIFSCEEGYDTKDQETEFDCCGQDWSTVKGPTCVKQSTATNIVHTDTETSGGTTGTFTLPTETQSSEQVLNGTSKSEGTADPSAQVTTEITSQIGVTTDPTCPTKTATGEVKGTTGTSATGQPVQSSGSTLETASQDAGSMNTLDTSATTETLLSSTTPRRSVLTLPAVIVQCFEPPEVENADVLGSARQYGATIKVRCKPNYSFPDGTTEKTVTCDNRGVWGPETSSCEALKCPALRPLAPDTDRDSEDRTHGSVVTYHCSPGHTFPDGSTYRTLICQTDGTWTSEAPVCKPKNCPGQDGEATLQAGETMITSCEGRKVLPDGQVSRRVFCTSTGRRVPEEPQSCEARCPQTPMVVNASQEFANHSVGGKARFTCLPGHNYPNGHPTKEITCLGPGLWSQTVIEPCVEVTCPPTPDLDRALADSDRALIGTVITYTCSQWHRFPGKRKTKVIKCLDNGNWSEIPPDCEPLLCPVPPDLGNAKHTGSERTVGKHVIYTCGKGLRFPDGYSSKNVVCQEDESWDIDPHASCEPNRCPPIPSADHTSTDKITTDQGSNVKYSCLPGYGVNGVRITQTTTCGPDLSWQDPPRDCTILSCPALPNISNADATGSSAQVFSQIHIRCRPGYQLEEGIVNTTVECLTTQEWSQDPDTIFCERIICGPLPETNHATKATFGRFRFRDQVWYVCDEGYENRMHEDHVIAVCDENGEWSFNFPRGCLRITCPGIYTWDGMVANSSSTDYMAGINYTCLEGYSFDDRWRYRLATCVKGSQWRPDLVECTEGKMPPVEIQAVEAPSAPNVGAVAISMLVLIAIFVISVDLISIWEAVQKAKMVRDEKASRPVEAFTSIAPWPGQVVPKRLLKPKPTKSAARPRYKPFAVA